MKITDVLFDCGGKVHSLRLISQNQNDKKFINAIEFYLAGDSRPLEKILNKNEERIR